MPIAPGDVIEGSSTIVSAFRDAALIAGFREESRVRVVSQHDPSIRFTNSTISVLKPRLERSDVVDRVFLVQPAMRLRNLRHFLDTGSVSPFGCSFLAFGALAPATGGAELALMAWDFLVSRLGLDDKSLSWWVGPDDPDLEQLGHESGYRVHQDERGAPYRHVFGIDDRVGRNANLHVESKCGSRAIANLILIEDLSGRAVGVELAFGANLLLMSQLGIEHSILAGSASAGLGAGLNDLMALDALQSSVCLAMDGLKPIARGRGGNYRAFLRILADRTDATVDIDIAAAAVIEAEYGLRTLASPPRPGAEDPAQLAVLQRFKEHYARVGFRAPTSSAL